MVAFLAPPPVAVMSFAWIIVLARVRNRGISLLRNWLLSAANTMKIFGTRRYVSQDSRRIGCCESPLHYSLRTISMAAVESYR